MIKTKNRKKEDLVPDFGYVNLDQMRDEIKEMKNQDIRTIDPSDLSDISDIKINNDLPIKERILSLLRQTRNPYCYTCQGAIVKISYAEKQTLEVCLVSCFS